MHRLSPSFLLHRQQGTRSSVSFGRGTSAAQLQAHHERAVHTYSMSQCANAALRPHPPSLSPNRHGNAVTQGCPRAHVQTPRRRPAAQRRRPPPAARRPPPRPRSARLPLPRRRAGLRRIRLCGAAPRAPCVVAATGARRGDRGRPARSPARAPPAHTRYTPRCATPARPPHLAAPAASAAAARRGWVRWAGVGAGGRAGGRAGGAQSGGRAGGRGRRAGGARAAGRGRARRVRTPLAVSAPLRARPCVAEPSKNPAKHESRFTLNRARRLLRTAGRVGLVLWILEFAYCALSAVGKFPEFLMTFDICGRRQAGGRCVGGRCALQIPAVECGNLCRVHSGSACCSRAAGVLRALALVLRSHLQWCRSSGGT